MSANLIVDVGGTANFAPSVVGAQYPTLSGTTVVGLPVDLINCDTYCNVFVIAGACSGPMQIQVQCTPQTSDVASGVYWSGGGFPVSGNFTDPTSGLAQLPTWFSSGATLWVNSGLYTVPGGGWLGSGQPVAVGGYPPGTYPYGLNPIFNAQGGATTAIIGSGAASGAYPVFGSGGVAFAAFQRTGRWARAVVTMPAGIGGSSGVSSGNYFVPPIVGFITQLDTTGSGGGFSWSPQSGGGNTALV